MSGVESILGELQALGNGYAPYIADTPKGKVVVIDYRIPLGKYKGEKVLLGFSQHGGEGYPEYPPHWIHISPPYDDQLGGAVESYIGRNREGQECSWMALSRLPKEMWDQLPTKHMCYYLDYHIRNFCKGLK